MRGQRSHSGAEPPTGRSWYCRVTVWKKHSLWDQRVRLSGNKHDKQQQERYEMISTTNQLVKCHPSVTILKHIGSKKTTRKRHTGILCSWFTVSLWHSDSANQSDAERRSSGLHSRQRRPQRVKAACCLLVCVCVCASRSALLKAPDYRTCTDSCFFHFSGSVFAQSASQPCVMSQKELLPLPGQWPHTHTQADRCWPRP